MSAEPWINAGPLGELAEGRGTRVDVGDEGVLLVRSGDRVYAIGSRCTHQGASLDRGPLKISGSLATVTCPAHGSIFGLEDGRVLRGPAARPATAYDTRVVEGELEIRRRF